MFFVIIKYLYFYFVLKSFVFLVYEATHHQRSEKAGGTIKIDGICPSKLIVKMFNTEQVIVVFWKAHAGHEEDLRTKHLTTIEKCNIVKKLEAGMPVFRILEDARKMENPNLERINLLNNMDVHYLMRKHNTEKKRHHNDVVAVRLKVAEWNLHGKNFAFFFKEKGNNLLTHYLISICIIKCVPLFMTPIS